MARHGSSHTHTHTHRPSWDRPSSLPGQLHQARRHSAQDNIPMGVMREPKVTATSFHCLIQVCIQNSATGKKKKSNSFTSESQPKPSVCCSKALVVSYLETPYPFTSSLCPWTPCHHEVCFPPVYGNKRNGVCVRNRTRWQPTPLVSSWP
ncbi:hypothetical protein LZ31DRAFT_14773 [Colletotrichum somersetense]|nr:hypothetical protein LZ31DRAFT_14773 [Colletotrichum somersetense]